MSHLLLPLLLSLVYFTETVTADDCVLEIGIGDSSLIVHLELETSKSKCANVMLNLKYGGLVSRNSVELSW